jgi:hypothetical protein
MAIRERRKGPRFNVHQPVHVVTQKQREECRSLDISLEGVKIEAGREVRPDDLLDLTLLVGESLVKAKGRVVYVEELLDGTFQAGVVFEEISPQGRASLLEYLSDIMNHGAERRGILKKAE